MENRELFSIIKELKLPRGEFVIFGSAPMGVRGIRECRDIDVLVTRKLYADLKKDKVWSPKKATSGSESLCFNNVELFENWPGINDVEKLIAEADIIDEMPFAKLERVIEWKKGMGREKDIKDVELIENYLKNS